MEYMENGWIKLHRQIEEHWLWEDKESFDKRSAWIDLLLIANHTEKKVLFRGELIIIKRGQILTSIRGLAEKWRWSVNKVYRFIKLLESDSMLKKESDKDRTLLTLVNYSVYQDRENTNENSNEYSSENSDGNKNENSSRNTNENSNEYNSGNSDGNKNDTQAETVTETKQERKELKNKKREKKNQEVSNDTSCTEPEVPSAAVQDMKEEPAKEIFVIGLPLNDKTEYQVSLTKFNEYKELYPAVDISQELRNMRGWLLSNPDRRKTRRGITRFINSWLARSQDNGKPRDYRNEPHHPDKNSTHQDDDPYAEWR